MRNIYEFLTGGLILAGGYEVGHGLGWYLAEIPKFEHETEIGAATLVFGLVMHFAYDKLFDRS